MSKEKPFYIRFIQTLFADMGLTSEEENNVIETYKTAAVPQEIVDARRLMELANNDLSSHEWMIGSNRLKEVVLSALNGSNPKETKGYRHALSELYHVRHMFPDDPEVLRTYDKYYNEEGFPK